MSDMHIDRNKTERLFTWGGGGGPRTGYGQPAHHRPGRQSDMSSRCDVRPAEYRLPADLSRPSPLPLSMRHHVFQLFGHSHAGQ